jgi:AraC family transcriptional regulator
MKLSAQQLEHVERALDYIESHLQVPVRVEDISQHVGYSLFHFCRIFNAATYISPYTYLMRRRISEAALQVLQSKRRLTDIAVDFGFQSSEVFGRSIKRLFGVLPSELRKTGILDPRLLLPALSGEKILSWQKFQGFTLIKEELPALKLFGLMTHWKDCDISALRAIFYDNNQAGTLSPSALVGVRFYPKHWSVRGRYCFAGYPLPEDVTEIPEWFVEKSFKSQSCLITSQWVSPENIDALLEYYHCVWFPNASYRADVPFLLERMPVENQVQIIWPAREKKQPA